MIFFACVVCKATHCLLRLFNFGATSLPGALALKICPDIRVCLLLLAAAAFRNLNGCFPAWAIRRKR